MTTDDAQYRFRLRALALAHELGSVRATCRAMGIHPSTYDRWRRQLLLYGPEILRPRERRPPRTANATSPLVEQRVVAFALGHPGVRASADLRRAPPSEVGRDRAVTQRGPPGSAAARVEHRGQAAGAGGRLRRPPSPSPGASPRAAPGGSPTRGDGPDGLLLSSAGSPGQRGPCGSTRPSTWEARTAGRSSTSPHATPRAGGARSWPGGVAPGPVPTGVAPGGGDV